MFKFSACFGLILAAFVTEVSAEQILYNVFTEAGSGESGFIYMHAGSFYLNTASNGDVYSDPPTRFSVRMEPDGKRYCREYAFKDKFGDRQKGSICGSVTPTGSDQWRFSIEDRHYWLTLPIKGERNFTFVLSKSGDDCLIVLEKHVDVTSGEEGRPGKTQCTLLVGEPSRKSEFIN